MYKLQRTCIILSSLLRTQIAVVIFNCTKAPHSDSNCGAVLEEPKPILGTGSDLAFCLRVQQIFMSGMKESSYNAIAALSYYDDEKEYVFLDSRYPTSVMNFGNIKGLQDTKVGWAS